MSIPSPRCSYQSYRAVLNSVLDVIADDGESSERKIGLIAKIVMLWMEETSGEGCEGTAVCEADVGRAAELSLEADRQVPLGKDPQWGGFDQRISELVKQSGAPKAKPRSRRARGKR